MFYNTLRLSIYLLPFAKQVGLFLIVVYKYYGSSVLLSSSCLYLIVSLLNIFCIYYSYTLVNVAIPFTLLLPFGTIFLESMSSSLL